MKGIKRIESLNENASDKHPKTNQIQSLVSILKLKKEEIFSMFRNRAMQENLINNAPAPIEEGRGDCHFMFIPGTRNDRVVLVAHADTVWDEIENFPPTLANSNGCIYSENKKTGIGVDDRVGIATLWDLWDLGHSMLITSGEENGVVAARYLVENVSNISDTLQEHQFMVEFDLDGKNGFKTYEVGSAEFDSYIADSTVFKNRGKDYWTDIVVLCKDICGVNLSIGYYDNETPQEYVNENDWLTILKMVRQWLGQENLPRFLREE